MRLFKSGSPRSGLDPTGLCDGAYPVVGFGLWTRLHPRGTANSPGAVGIEWIAGSDAIVSGVPRSSET